MPGPTDEKIIRDAELIGTLSTCNSLADAIKLAADGVIRCARGQLTPPEAAILHLADDELAGHLGQFCRTYRETLADRRPSDDEETLDGDDQPR